MLGLLPRRMSSLKRAESRSTPARCSQKATQIGLEERRRCQAAALIWTRGLSSSGSKSLSVNDFRPKSPVRRSIWPSGCVSLLATGFFRPRLGPFELQGRAFLATVSWLNDRHWSRQVRWIVAIVIALGAIGCVACQFDVPSTLNSNPLAASRWRRTNHGWERLISNQVSDRAGDGTDLPPPHPHPIVFALFLTLASVFMLLACSPSNPHSMQVAASQTPTSDSHLAPRRLNSI